jgi:hypothetical protein
MSILYMYWYILVFMLLDLMHLNDLLLRNCLGLYKILFFKWFSSILVYLTENDYNIADNVVL